MESARSAEASWRHPLVTPSREDRGFDVAKGRISLRDALLTAVTVVGIIIGALGLVNRIENSQQLQQERLNNLRQEFELREQAIRRELEEVKRGEAYNAVMINEDRKVQSEVKGMLSVRGAGR